MTTNATKIRQQAIAKLDDGATDFKTWFTAQFGPEPECVLWSDVVAAQRKADETREKNEQLFVWQQRRDAALKAWAAGQSKVGR